jgi:hypothetical protein
MELTTHFISGLAIGFVVFHQPQLAFLVALGATLPDLDREYWFIPQNVYRDEQLHRSLFHNIFVISAIFLISPFLSFGLFLHSFEDSFTTVKDRGVEWLYPLTRWAKRGLYDADGKPRPLDPKEHVYLYQEDPKGFVDKADPDLQEPGPVPWRRCYGFAQNGKIVDHGLLIGSIAIMAIWFVVPNLSNVNALAAYVQANYLLWVIGFGAVAFLFGAGELDRRDKSPSKRGPQFLKYPLFIIGVALSGAWLYSFRAQIVSNMQNLASNYLFIVLSLVAILIIAIAMILWQTKLFKSNATV